MTEKRFHFGYVLGDTGLIDEQAEHKWFIENCCNITDLKKNWKTVCDKLNELADENEQLKKDCTALIYHNQEYRKENEQLKERNNRQAKRLRELYELIAKKDWESLTEIIDDFCSCEEQLQREWRTYE